MPLLVGISSGATQRGLSTGAFFAEPGRFVWNGRAHFCQHDGLGRPSWVALWRRW